MILTAPEPPSTALIPLPDPDTDEAVIAIPDPLASLTVRIASPPEAVSDPLTAMEIAPPPELVATMPSAPAVTGSPLADCVKEIPPVPPVCVSVNAIPSVSAGVSAFSVTDNAVAPLALRD